MAPHDMVSLRALLVDIQVTQQEILARLENLETCVADSNARYTASIQHVQHRMRTSAAAEVFSIHELVEKILVHLDESELWRLQPQSQIQAAISTSPALQRKLFLLADTAASQVRINPFVFIPDSSHQATSFFNHLVPAVIIRQDQNGAESCVRRLCATASRAKKKHIMARDKPWRKYVVLRRVYSNQLTGSVFMSFRELGSRELSMSETEGSRERVAKGAWKKMLLARPPRDFRWELVGTDFQGVIPAELGSNVVDVDDMGSA